LWSSPDVVVVKLRSNPTSSTSLEPVVVCRLLSRIKTRLHSSPTMTVSLAFSSCCSILRAPARQQHYPVPILDLVLLFPLSSPRPWTV
jgi:hypothetical protein